MSNVRKFEAITGLWLISSLCVQRKRRERERDGERERKKEKKQITVTVGTLLGTQFSNYSYRRATAGELINDYSYSRGPSQELEM